MNFSLEILHPHFYVSSLSNIFCNPVREGVVQQKPVSQEKQERIRLLVCPDEVIILSRKSAEVLGIMRSIYPGQMSDTNLCKAHALYALCLYCPVSKEETHSSEPKDVKK